jgi:hypoxanthine phosphoribosyltransferase
MIGRTLISEEQIMNKAVEVAAKINADYAGKPVLFIGILRGSVIWMCELLKHIDLDAEIDFMSASSYGDSTTSSGAVAIRKDLDESIEGRHVIIVEDIVDTGNTLSRLLTVLGTRGPASLAVCSMLDKPSRRTVKVDIDYCGFTVEDIFVIGYGLDAAGKYRNLPYIAEFVEA